MNITVTMYSSRRGSTMESSTIGEKGEKDLLRMLGARGTKQILEFLDQHGLCQYKQLEEFMNTHTLNIRLREMLTFGLVQFYFDRIETRERI